MERIELKKENCPFCADKINNSAFIESPNFLVIYNNAPILPGHSLVIPKNHIESLLELNQTELFEFIQLSIKATKIILKVFKADSFNWTIQEKPEAGQTVSHLHLHIFPRHDKDLPNPGDWYPILKSIEETQYNNIDSKTRPKYTNEEIIKIVNHIKEQILLNGDNI
jgi:bis(5'-adenosyl)-triphosphatase